jgi:hypothetical protein
LAAVSAGCVTTAELGFGNALAQIVHHTAHGSGVGQKIRRPGVELRLQNGHSVLSTKARLIFVMQKSN